LEALKVKIVYENVISSIKWLTGTLAFLFFMIIGLIADVELTRLLIAGIAVYILFTVLGVVTARILGRIHEENQLEPRVEKEDHEKEIGRHLDWSQGAEMPMPE